jgi:hypothetical protein
VTKLQAGLLATADLWVPDLDPAQEPETELKLFKSRNPNRNRNTSFWFRNTVLHFI